MRKRVKEHADLGALQWRAMEWRMLAKRLRMAAGVEASPIVQGGPRTHHEDRARPIDAAADA